jgi:NADH-quinone oxidoreductase subunit J
MAEIIFYFFSILLILSAFIVVLANNPIHSVMALIFAFLNGAIILLMIGLEFFPLLLIIVYVGAVVILFLFIVMTITSADQNKGFKWLLMPFFLILSLPFLQTLEKTSFTKGTSQGDFSVKALGMTLYSDYFLQFHLAGLILLVALIGIIVVTQQDKKEGIKKQSLWKQLMTNPKERIILIKEEK